MQYNAGELLNEELNESRGDHNGDQPIDVADDADQRESDPVNNQLRRGSGRPRKILMGKPG